MRPVHGEPRRSSERVAFIANLWAFVVAIQQRLERLVDVVLESKVRCFRFSLIGSSDSPLHFILDSVKRVNLDERIVLPSLDSAVQPRESTVDRVAEDIRNSLTRPGSSSLRPVPIPI